MRKFSDEADLAVEARDALDSAARSILGVGVPRPVGVVLDTRVYEPDVPDGIRFAAVVRTPDDYLIVGRFADDRTASVANESFYEGMRRLVAPAKEAS